MPTRSLLPLLGLVLAGCMPFRLYPLPVSGAEASRTFAPIATAASNLGYRYYQQSDRVTVIPDADIRLVFTLDASGNYGMYVMLQRTPAPEQVETAFAAGKAKGDDLWNRAMAIWPLGRPPLPVVAPPPPGVQVEISR